MKYRLAAVVTMIVIISCAKPSAPIVPVSFQMRLVSETNAAPAQQYFLNGEMLYLEEMVYVFEGDVIKAIPGTDEYGRSMVHVNLNSEGTRRLYEVTDKNHGRRLAVVVDNKIRFAPMIMETIPTGKLQFPVASRSEAFDLARRLSRH